MLGVQGVWPSGPTDENDDTRTPSIIISRPEEIGLPSAPSRAPGGGQFLEERTELPTDLLGAEKALPRSPSSPSPSQSPSQSSSKPSRSWYRSDSNGSKPSRPSQREAEVLVRALSDHLQEERKQSCCSHLYLWSCLFTSTTMSFLIVGMLSSMGYGQVTIDRVQAADWLFYPAALTCVVIVLLLYLLDFYKPPHIPGRYMLLWPNDAFVGRSLFGLAIACFLAAILFTSSSYPFAPMAVAVLLIPLALSLVRRWAKKQGSQAALQAVAEQDKTWMFEGLSRQIQSVLDLETSETDLFLWHKAVSTALFVSGLATLICWIIWVVYGENPLDAPEVCVDGWLAPTECSDTFMYNGKTYSGCTEVDSSQPWCAHNAVYSGAWSTCIKCEESSVRYYTLSNASCVLDAVDWKGDLATTLEGCQHACSQSSTCSYIIYFGDDCISEECLSRVGVEGQYRCGLLSEFPTPSADNPPIPAELCKVYEAVTKMTEFLSQHDRDELYIVWSTPLILAVTQFVLSGLAGLRIVLHRAYTTALSTELELESSMEMKVSSMAEGVKRRAQANQERSLRRLSLFVKLSVCSFIITLGCIWVAWQLLYADSQVAMMCMIFMGAYFVIFISWVLTSLRRVVDRLWDWLVRFKLWRTLSALLRSDWSRVALCVPALPVLPLLLLLDMFHQAVRIRRGIYKRVNLKRVAPSDVGIPCNTSATDLRYAQSHQLSASNSESVLTPRPIPSTSSPAPRTDSDITRDQQQDRTTTDNSSLIHSWGQFSSGEPMSEPAISQVNADNYFFTPPVHKFLSEAMLWDWLSLTLKAYLLAAAFVAYSLFPLCLNVFLAWFNDYLIDAELNFVTVVVITFFTGVAAFLLPPVPGLTVYIFGGLMLSATCPDGFWAGAGWNIVMGWFLKLFACAIQQVVIGGFLGKSLWVRQTVGVHKLAVRCIEGVLREPGLTLGKIAILCGGPDWPTSVLAGILNLSVWQCELGTFPIIFFIVPCSLSGSFYLKKGTSDVWDRSADLMILTSVIVNMLLWALVAWAMQHYLETHYTELTRPLPQNVDLEWLDYRAAELKKEAQVNWRSLPLLVRGSLGLGAIIHVGVGHAVWWGYNYLVNHFEVSDSIHTLNSWYGDKGVVTFLGVIVLATYAVSWLAYIQYFVWVRWTTKECIAAKSLELEQAEAAWKQDWLKKAREWTPPNKEPTPN